jgi:hypothetical protein
MTLEELAQNLRPVMLLNGQEYEASWSDALALAEAAIKARQNSQRGLVAPDQPHELTQQKAVTPPTDSRQAIHGQNATNAPYKYLGFMRRRIPARPLEVDYCTCIKMINHATCVTAAHCVNTGPPEDAKPGETPGEWKRLAEITFLATSGNPMPTLDPHLGNPYAVIMPRGFRTNRRLDYAVIRFRGPASFLPGELTGDQIPLSPDGNPAVANVDPQYFHMGANEYAGVLAYPLPLEPVNPPVSQALEGQFILAGFPGIDPKEPQEYPHAACGSMSPCLASGSASVLTWRSRTLQWRSYFFYAIDASGGQSGGGVFAVGPSGSSFPYSVVAIHKGSGAADYSPQPIPDYPRNVGVRITEEVIQFLVSAAGGSGTVFP